LKTIGETIARLRREHGLTQEEFAARIGVSAQSVSKWETGTNMPDIMLLPVIADIFGVTIDEIYGKTASSGGKSISFDQVPQQAYDALLRVMQYAWNAGDSEALSQLHIDENVEKVKENLKGNPHTQTAIFAGLEQQEGAVYANASLGLIYTDRLADSLPLLEDTAAIGFLSALADGNFRRMLSYRLSVSTSFTAASAGGKCGLTESEASAALEKLEQYGLVMGHMVDLGDETLRIWQPWGTHRMLLVYTILSLCRQLSDYRESYFGFRG